MGTSFNEHRYVCEGNVLQKLRTKLFNSYRFNLYILLVDTILRCSIRCEIFSKLQIVKLIVSIYTNIADIYFLCGAGRKVFKKL